MAMMDRAVGPERMKVLRSQFRVWERSGGEAGIEAWRRRMRARMFCLRRQAVQSGVADVHAAVGHGCQLADLAGRSRAKRFQSRPGSGPAILLDRVQQGAPGPRQGGLPGSVHRQRRRHRRQHLPGLHERNQPVRRPRGRLQAGHQHILYPESLSRRYRVCIRLCGQFRVEWFLRGEVARCPVKLRGNVRARQRRPARTDQTPESTPHMPLNANDFLNYWCGHLFPLAGFYFSVTSSKKTEGLADLASSVRVSSVAESGGVVFRANSVSRGRARLTLVA